MLFNYRPEEVIIELFEAAERASKHRFVLSLLDLGRIYDPRGNKLTLGDVRDFAMEEFCRFFNEIINSPFSAGKGRHFFLRKLRLLAYSQFWDCRSIQRTLTSLVRIVAGERYDPDLYSKDAPSTWKVMKTLQEEAHASNIKLGSFLKGVYKNQIRNAFVHSEYFFTSQYLSLLNYDRRKSWTVPSIRIDEWNEIYEAFESFATALFRTRSQQLSQFKTQCPIIVKASELEKVNVKELVINYDSDRRRWSFGKS